MYEDDSYLMCVSGVQEWLVYFVLKGLGS